MKNSKNIPGWFYLSLNNNVNPQKIADKYSINIKYIGRQVIKELLDNAFDTGKFLESKLDLEEGSYLVRDEGGGIDLPPEKIEELFRSDRGVISTKFLRKFTRGIFGEGLKFVGDVVASVNGSIDII